MTPSGDSTPNRIGDAYDNLAPNSGKVLCRVEPPSAEQIESAVTNAKRAAQEWSELSAWVRGSALRDMARIVDQNMEDLCELEALDSGLPISQIRTNHIPYCAKTLEYYASLIQSGMWHGNTIVDTPHAGGHADSFSYTRREPLGVCLGIGGET
jgi:5-carboxymethyl-2-hydroxymuconic-semialdehyde dehydrogenase